MKMENRDGFSRFHGPGRVGKPHPPVKNGFGSKTVAAAPHPVPIISAQRADDRSRIQWHNDAGNASLNQKPARRLHRRMKVSRNEPRSVRTAMPARTLCRANQPCGTSKTNCRLLDCDCTPRSSPGCRSMISAMVPSGVM